MAWNKKREKIEISTIYENSDPDVSGQGFKNLGTFLELFLFLGSPIG